MMRYSKYWNLVCSLTEYSDSIDSCLPTSLFLESRKPADTEGKKQYDREFLLDLQFMPACIQKPEGLPPISDVVLDKVSYVCTREKLWFGCKLFLIISAIVWIWAIFSNC